MRINKKILLITSGAFFMLAATAYASSSGFLTQAQNYINANCSKNKIPDQTALICYLFNKVQEHDTSIANINTTLSQIPSQVTDLQNRVSKLESEINTTPVPLLSELIFAYNRPASFTTDGTTVPITPNYNWESMTMHVSTSGTLSDYSLIVNLGSGDFEQVRIPCGQQTCPEVTIPLILYDSQGGNSLPRAIYKFSTGTSSGNITAIGTLNAEPNS